MDIEIAISQNTSVELREVLCIYKGGHSGAFVTHHDVLPGEPPVLGVGTSLTVDTLQALVRDLGGNTAAEVLPENVIARTDRMISWWMPSQRHQMFFGKDLGDLSKISGRTFPHPPLLFNVSDQTLTVRALPCNERPTAKTNLMVAPYWNMDSHGVVCMGTARVPRECSVASIPGWSKAFWMSEFTHAGVGVRITSHPGGFAGLWQQIANQKGGFPMKSLVNANQKISSFLQGT
jgi:PRTRC genetic system protein B